MDLEIHIDNIKNIKHADFEIPFEKGLYAFVGENGCGKSTLMLLLSLIIKTSSIHMLSSEELAEDSKFELVLGDKKDIWCTNSSNELSTNQFHHKKQMYANIHYRGFYEGSIFYGSRFYDYNKIDDFLEDNDIENVLINCDSFVSESLGYILHNDKEHYKGLKKLKTRKIAKEAGFRGVPYFLNTNGKLISQYKMSSGESMLISLIDFINNLVIRGSYEKLFFLIDEVELALHPGAIDRLYLFLSDLVNNSKSDIIVYFATHASELIQKLPPKNIFLIENENGNINCITPCYPNYAIRNLYVPNGFDYLILVEDELAKILVEKVIRNNRLAKNKLCCVIPAGGCDQMIQLHHDLIQYNALGVGKKIISVYDGDVKGHISKRVEYTNLPKTFLPVNSIEKYLKKKCIDENDSQFIKTIGDKYFNQRALIDIIKDYRNDVRTKSDNSRKIKNGKAFYEVFMSNLKSIGITEREFLNYFCDDIYDMEDFYKFENQLTQLLS